MFYWGKLTVKEIWFEFYLHFKRFQICYIGLLVARISYLLYEYLCIVYVGTTQCVFQCRAVILLAHSIEGAEWLDILCVPKNERIK